ncbi:hypothetical protein MNB_ARC-1_346 [hydrothermal vent metagenome]|uniref:Cytochrome C n=1 Tax=hydrothermal vent metagenome TaxID=652676 RepID=A0A3B1E794_9ZZZZ
MLFKLMFLGTVALIFITTTVNADASKGQKLFSKKFKKACTINGAKMAAKHSQDEWEAIQEDGKLAKEFKRICPDLEIEDIKEKYIPHLYDFVYEYANDSGNVPSC